MRYNVEGCAYYLHFGFVKLYQLSRCYIRSLECTLICMSDHGGLTSSKNWSISKINLLAARNERESVQIALRPKVSWGGSGIAGLVQVHCNDLCSTSGDRLVS